MKFLLVNYEYPPIGAGAATATQAIARNLVKLGHQVTVLTARFGDLPPLRVEDGVVVRRVKCWRRHPDRCTIAEMTSFVFAACFCLRSIVKASRPDAVIAFFSIPCGPIALLARLLFGVPYVVSLRGGDVPGLVPEIRWVHGLLGPLRRTILKHAVGVVANSNGLRDLSEATDPIKVQVVPNGVDSDFFHPVNPPDPPSDSPFRIVFTGRLQAQKNVVLLLDQYAEIRASSPVPVELHLVGDGPLRSELENHADDIGLNGSVNWHGWTHRDELREVYQRSHCFVNPSFYEGMPNAVLEAMACGLPVVASDIPGNGDVVRHAETGFLFDLTKPGGLRDALNTMVQDRQRAERMGHRGRVDAEQNFSWGRVAWQYADLFASS